MRLPAPARVNVTKLRPLTLTSSLGAMVEELRHLPQQRSDQRARGREHRFTRTDVAF